MTMWLVITAVCGWAGWALSLLDMHRLRKSLLAELEADERESDANHRTVLAAMDLIVRRPEAVRVCACKRAN